MASRLQRDVMRKWLSSAFTPDGHWSDHPETRRLEAEVRAIAARYTRGEIADPVRAISKATSRSLERITAEAQRLLRGAR
jgi:hypothetical protein